MRGRPAWWMVILVFVLAVSTVNVADARDGKEIQTKPTYSIKKVAGKYDTSFRKNGRIFYSVKTKKKPVVKFVSTRKLTAEMIEHRKSKAIIYVEIDNGTVLNRKKDGIDEMGYYVCYKRVRGIRKGSKILSYFVYDPNNNYIDGIEGRCDYVIRK